MSLFVNEEVGLKLHFIGYKPLNVIQILQDFNKLVIVKKNKHLRSNSEIAILKGRGEVLSWDSLYQEKLSSDLLDLPLRQNI